VSEEDSSLSQRELDTLFQSIEVAQARVGSGQQSAQVTLYDFRQASKLSPDQVRQVQEVLQNLARVLRRTLGLYLNASVWLETRALSQGTGEQYLSNLPDQPITALFELLPHAPKAVWHVDAPLAYAALHCMLGGKPGRCEVVTDREVSPVEATVLRRFFREILDTWALTWTALGQGSPSVREVVGDLAKLDGEVRHEQVVMALIEGNIAGNEGRMWVGLPAGVLQMILRQGENREGERRVSPSLLSSTGTTQVALQVVLGTRRMWLSELRSLEEGAILDLGHHTQDPVEVRLAGKRKFAGRTGVQRGRVAIEITGTS
jgi:flagellar motor switch protein FliM